jgi:hypothetical protein
MKPGPEPRGTVGLTKISLLVSALLVSAMVVWLVFSAMDAAGLALPFIPVLVPVALAVVAALVGLGAWLTYRTVQVKKEVIHSKAALQRLALGKSAALAGAIIAGGYLAIAAYSLPHLYGESARARFWTALAAGIAGIALSVCGCLLEWSCRVPPDDTDEKVESPA